MAADRDIAESVVNVQASLVPRHYRVGLQASLTLADMLELVQALNERVDVDDTACGGFFGTLRQVVAEAYSGDLPQPITVPDTLPDEGDDRDEPTGGVPAKT